MAWDRSDYYRGKALKMGKGKPGTLGEHLRWASLDGYRITAYAPSERAGEGGGYSTQRYAPGIGWCLCDDDTPIPADTERALCEALGLEYVWDDRYTLAADEPWTVADILAREG